MIEETNNNAVSNKSAKAAAKRISQKYKKSRNKKALKLLKLAGAKGIYNKDTEIKDLISKKAHK